MAKPICVIFVSNRIIKGVNRDISDVNKFLDEKLHDYHVIALPMTNTQEKEVEGKGITSMKIYNPTSARDNDFYEMKKYVERHLKELEKNYVDRDRQSY